MTLLSELIEIPGQVHKSDFVISLATAIEEPERTVGDYVMTDQLAVCFDRALSLVATPPADKRSKAAYLRASLSAGKTGHNSCRGSLVGVTLGALPNGLNGGCSTRDVPV